MPYSPSFSSVYCAVEIYTLEGKYYQFFSSDSDSGILACTIDFHINNAGGVFTVVIPPGGPNGVSASPSWTEVLTPMSLCVIALQRANHSNVVMVGVITNIQESQTWNPASSVIRTITISGMDFSIFFKTFNFATLSFLGANAIAQEANKYFSQAENDGILSSGLFEGTPGEVAAAWYNRIMVGKYGILANTKVPISLNNTVPIRDVIGQDFQDYPAVLIPVVFNFMAGDSSWENKFKEVLQFPPYEYFVGTGQESTWTSNLSGGTGFFSKLLPKATPAIPQVIGRLNPQPDLNLTFNKNSNVDYSITSANMDLWNQLNLYTLDNGDGSVIKSSIQFGINDARNFYLIDPTGFNMIYYKLLGNTSIFFMAFQGAADPASIERYGYRPYKFSTIWCNTALVSASENPKDFNSPANAQKFVAMLTTRLASYCEPLPLMANSSITIEMRPDIFAGNRLQYSPFHNLTEDWLFYIEGIQHSFVFGGPSTTTLTLSRGLPSTVYSDSDMMLNLLQGNVMRQDGIYTIGLPQGSPSSLLAVGRNTQSQLDVLAQIARAYVSPQAK